MPWGLLGNLANDQASHDLNFGGGLVQTFTTMQKLGYLKMVIHVNDTMDKEFPMGIRSGIPLPMELMFILY